ncbi:hypothetical protein MPL3365_210117 [Mesorhizobium plurifarium]|uniref:Uncharacterized protein n=1 Tax=Mesorhizobium plurifarium TaxID=69974 RepID=A0A090GAH8_MESPL|nr:hypothetical protein MPL3365_210117 [Mesorhizobium plurifarium]
MQFYPVYSRASPAGLLCVLEGFGQLELLSPYSAREAKWRGSKLPDEPASQFARCAEIAGLT